MEAVVGMEVVGGVEVRRAVPEEMSGALRRILGQGGGLATDDRVADFLSLSVRRGFDLTRVAVGVRKGVRNEGAEGMVWAVLPILTPGGSALLLTPGRVEAGDERAAAAVVEFVVRELSGVQLVQGLVDPADASAAQPLLDAGFEPLATLIYLQRQASGSQKLKPLPKGMGGVMREVHYSPEAHDLFRRAISSTYVNSLDCPRLNGRRSMDDVIADHKSAGDFDPGLWSVVVDGEIPAAVMLLSPAPREETMELVYLGIAPEYRRRGLGQWCVRRALSRTQERGLSRLTLAVDAGNKPALNLYYGCGMRKVHERMALLRDLRMRGS